MANDPESDDIRYRDVIRSKILRRIQESKNFDVLSDDVDDDGDQDKRRIGSPAGIEQKLRGQLSTEWRKTLERVLNYQDGYIDGKLEVTRKDSIRFFIQTEWPDEEDQDQNEEKKKGSRKKKNRKLRSKASNQAVKWIPPFDPDKVLVVRQPKVSWSCQGQDESTVLTTEYYVDYSVIEDEDLRWKIARYLDVRALARLIRENVDLTPLINIDLLLLHLERFVIQDQPYNPDAVLNRCDLIKKSKWYRMMAKLTGLFGRPSQPSVLDSQLNNRLFMLSIGYIRLDLIRHPGMGLEDRMAKRLFVAFDRYQVAVSTDQKLDRLQRQIDTIVSKLHQEDASDTRIDATLLRRLLEKRDQLILKRRESLIDLLQQWSRFQNSLTKSSGILNEIDLKLEEIEDQDDDGEKKIYQEILSKRLEIERLIKKILETEPSKLNEAQIKDKTFLEDGRLPGEPKFKTPIELILPPKFLSAQCPLTSIYSVEILLGAKVVAHFDGGHLDRKFSTSWSNFHSFPMPIRLDRTYNFVENHLAILPRIRVQEKCSSDSKQSVTLAEIQLENLPSPKTSKPMEFEQEFYDQDGKRKPKLHCKLSGRMYWSNVPKLDDFRFRIEDGDPFWMFDADKRRIRELEDLDEIDQWLHEIRYWVDSSTEDDHYHRQVELMQMLLRQKYQLELSGLYEEKRKQLKRLNNSNSGEERKPEPMPFRNDGTFCSDEQIESNKRFQMMIDRNKGHLDYRFIPLTGTDLLLADIRTDESDRTEIETVLEMLNSSYKLQRDRLQDQPDTFVVPVDRAKMDTVARILFQIWDGVLKWDPQTGWAHGGKEIGRIEEIVKEPTLDEWLRSIPWLRFFWGSTASSDDPATVTTAIESGISVLEAMERDIQIVLHVHQAFNVPLKAGSMTFVEIKIDQNNQTMTTSTSEGLAPFWKESFKFKTKMIPKNCLNFNVFSIRSRDEMEESDNSKSSERCWLGQLRLPLSLLMYQKNIEGSFRIWSPYFIRSYRGQRRPGHLFGPDPGRHRSIDLSGNLANTVDKVMAMYPKDTENEGWQSSALGALPDVRLAVSISSHPSIEQDFASIPSSQSMESVDLVDHCDRWLASFRARFPNRRFVCLVDNLHRRSVLCIRYLAPIKPPSFEELSPVELDTKTEGMRKKSKLSKLAHKESLYISLIIRFVSLIPSLLEHQAGTIPVIDARFVDRWTRSNIWMDAGQFLACRLGCQADHAILLCCFLMYLDKRVALAIGTGLLDGPAVYVIVFPGSDSDPAVLDAGAIAGQDERDPRRIILIDPKRGEQFFVQDEDCTMVSVDCLVTADNIYANVQRQTRPGHINFNLQRSSHWQPLFSAGRNHHWSPSLDISVQPHSIKYTEANHETAKSFEIKLETYLREQLMEWRRQQTGSSTMFNRFCAGVIKRAMTNLEPHRTLAGHRYYGAKLAQLETTIQEELDQIYDVHRMIGFPINVTPERDFEQIWRLIHSTNLHSTHFGVPSQAEHVLAVHVHSYPCQLYSIWIYAAVVTTKAMVTT